MVQDDEGFRSRLFDGFQRTATAIAGLPFSLGLMALGATVLIGRALMGLAEGGSDAWNKSVSPDGNGTGATRTPRRTRTTYASPTSDGAVDPAQDQAGPSTS